MAHEVGGVLAGLSYFLNTIWPCHSLKKIGSGYSELDLLLQAVTRSPEAGDADDAHRGAPRALPLGQGRRLAVGRHLELSGEHCPPVLRALRLRSTSSIWHLPENG